MFEILIGEDNIACIKDSETPTVSDISKEIDVKYQFLDDYVTKGEVGLHFVDT